MERPRKRRGCLGCFTVVLVLTVLLVGWVAAVRWGLLEKLGLRQPVAERVFAPPPDRAGAAALRGALEQSGMNLQGVDIYVLPTSEGGSVALLSLDASQGFDLERWLNDANSQGGVNDLFDERTLDELNVTRLGFDYVDSSGKSIVTLTASVDELKQAGESEDEGALLKALMGRVDVPGVIREVTP